MVAWEERKYWHLEGTPRALSLPAPSIPSHSHSQSHMDPDIHLGRRGLCVRMEAAAEAEKHPFPFWFPWKQTDLSSPNRVKIAPCPVSLQSVSMGTGREGGGS